MKRACVLCALVAVLSQFLVLPVFAASLDDVVYLKNGSVIRGTIVEEVPNVSVKIETRDGSVFFYQMSEILKITKEEPKYASQPDNGSRRNQASVPWSEIMLSANPLGFLFGGPTVTLEVKTVSTLYITGTLGWYGAGLVPNLLTQNLQPNSLYGDFGPRYYFQNKNSSGGFYVGMKYLIGFSNQLYGNELDPSSLSQVPCNRYILARFQAVLAEGGYCWRLRHFLLSAGGNLGYGGTFYDQYWYDDNPSVKHDNTPVTVPWIEAVLGLGFGVF